MSLMTHSQEQRFLSAVKALTREQTVPGTVIECGDGLTVELDAVENIPYHDGSGRCLSILTEREIQACRECGEKAGTWFDPEPRCKRCGALDYGYEPPAPFGKGDGSALTLKLT